MLSLIHNGIDSEFAQMSDSPGLRQSLMEQRMGVGVILLEMIPPEKAANFQRVMSEWNARFCSFR